MTGFAAYIRSYKVLPLTLHRQAPSTNVGVALFVTQVSSHARFLVLWLLFQSKCELVIYTVGGYQYLWHFIYQQFGRRPENCYTDSIFFLLFSSDRLAQDSAILHRCALDCFQSSEFQRLFWSESFKIVQCFLCLVSTKLISGLTVEAFSLNEVKRRR